MKIEPLDLTREIKEPNGSPIPWDGLPRATLGGVIYGALTRIPVDAYADQEHNIDLALEIVGKDSFAFTTKDLAGVQALVRKISDPRIRVLASRMLEIKGKDASEIPAKPDPA